MEADGSMDLKPWQSTEWVEMRCPKDGQRPPFDRLATIHALERGEQVTQITV